MKQLSLFDTAALGYGNCAGFHSGGVKPSERGDSE
jgi:hypothetical protein